MFTIEMLPAQQGDAIWIEYGNAAAPSRILIDGGTPPTADVIRTRIKRLPSEHRRFELLVVTHIDTDHIGGILKLLADRPSGLAFDDVWFNAWRHLQNTPSSQLGPIDGEILSDALDKLKWPWNRAFEGGPVLAPDNQQISSKTLPGGMQLTILSPSWNQLIKLRKDWSSVVREAGLDPADPGRPARLLQRAVQKGVQASILGDQPPNVGYLVGRPFVADKATANGSTIALLAEFEGKSCLLTGDAFPEVLMGAIHQLLHVRRSGTLRVDAVKVPHHGSRYNISNDFLARVRSSQYLVSTSGAVFGHPDQEAIARIISANRLTGSHLSFNYPKTHEPFAAKKVKWTAAEFDDSGLQKRYQYDTTYATQGSGIMLAL